MTTDRTKGIGGTDIGAIIGANPWKGPMDVYLEKTGITEPQEDNENMYWGREMEPVLAKRYAKETGINLFIPDSSELPLQSNKYPWYLGSPDGLIYLYDEKLADDDPGNVIEGGVDFKTTGRRNDYGDPGTDQVPEFIHCQADWYMGLTEAQWWDIAVLFFSPRREFQIYRIPRNQELINNLIATGREFWENHVVPRIPPPLDSSEASKRLLNHLYPRNVEDLFAADEQTEYLAKQIRTYEMLRDADVKELTLLQNKLKEKIGDHAGVVTSFGKITWKKNKDSEVVDWKAAFDWVTASDPHLQKANIIKQFTTIRPGSRVFRAWWKDKED